MRMNYQRAISELRGAVLMAAVSIAWYLWAAAAVPDSWMRVLVLLLISTSIVVFSIGRRLLVTLRRGRPGPDGANPLRLRTYRAAVLFEAVAILIAVLLLGGRPAAARYLPTVVALIVGVHFLGLVAAFGSRIYFVVCAAMCLFGLAALGVPSPAMRAMIVGIGCGVVLDTTSLIRIRSVRIAYGRTRGADASDT
jgi:hypothetical protein